jgi:predicted RNase H-like nuclease (RuvC/YqgF family)
MKYGWNYTPTELANFAAFHDDPRVQEIGRFIYHLLQKTPKGMDERSYMFDIPGTISELEATVSNYRREIAELEETITDLYSQVSSLQYKLDDSLQNEVIQQHEGTIFNLRRERNSLIENLKGKTCEVGDLTEKLNMWNILSKE